MGRADLGWRLKDWSACTPAERLLAWQRGDFYSFGIVLYQLAFQVRFQWEPDSIDFWDNRCVQHLAVWVYFPQTRSGYCLMIEGDRPA